MDMGTNRFSARIMRAEIGNPDVDQVLSFRKQLFVDHLKWNLPIQSPLETDTFDRPDAVYAALYRDGSIIGSFRAIRADRPYLADSAFPELAVTRSYPKSPRCFEISRFGVWPTRSAKRDAAVLYALMFHFALIRRVRSLIAVTDLYHERYLAQRRIRTRRFGPPREYPGTDASSSFTLVAGEIPIGFQTETDLRSLLSHLNGVTIHDDTLVYGRQSISA